jgi:hypothetical protein
MLFLGVVVLALLAADAAGIVAAPVEVHHEVATTASRLLVEELPLPFLAAVGLLPLVFTTAGQWRRHRPA